MQGTPEDLIEQLGLQPHPEGGYYVETFRPPGTITLPDGRIRAPGTAIYFLLLPGTFSALHRVAADEVWHHYGGAPLELVTITPGGTLERFVLGPDLRGGQRPQHVVASGVWQGARPIGNGHALVGCTVSPGFDFADFEMPGRGALTELFPIHATVIGGLTRPD